MSVWCWAMSKYFNATNEPQLLLLRGSQSEVQTRAAVNPESFDTTAENIVAINDFVHI